MNPPHIYSQCCCKKILIFGYISLTNLYDEYGNTYGNTEIRMVTRRVVMNECTLYQNAQFIASMSEFIYVSFCSVKYR